MRGESGAKWGDPEYRVDHLEFKASRTGGHCGNKPGLPGCLERREKELASVLLGNDEITLPATILSEKMSCLYLFYLFNCSVYTPAVAGLGRPSHKGKGVDRGQSGQSEYSFI